MGIIDSATGKIKDFLGDVNTPENRSLADSVGVNAAQAALNLLFPKDFEYYMMALELATYDGRTIDYFVFPVMPSSYSQTEPSVTNIRKTMGGVSAVGNSSFVPITIQINGNFGKRFRITSGSIDSLADFTVALYSTASGAFNKEMFNKTERYKYRKIVMNNGVKSGYGALKILQAICDKSRGDIDGKPNQLYLYNPALGGNFLVKVNSFQAIQDSASSNMVWNYSLQLTAIAPMEALFGIKSVVKSLVKAMSKDVVTKSANGVAKSVSRYL